MKVTHGGYEELEGEMDVWSRSPAAGPDDQMKFDIRILIFYKKIIRAFLHLIRT